MADQSDIRLNQKLDRLTFEVSQPRQSEQETKNLFSTVFFTTGGYKWGVESHFAQGTVLFESLTPLPGAPSFIMGLTNFHGLIIPVLDIMHALGGEPPMTEEIMGAVLIGDPEVNIALAVNKPPSVLRLDRAEIVEFSDHVAPIDPQYLIGKSPGNIHILDATVLLFDEIWVVNQLAELVE